MATNPDSKTRSDEGAAAGGVDIPPPATLVEAPIIFADALVHTGSLNSVMRMAFVQNMPTPANMDPAGVGTWTARHVVTIAVPLNSLPHMVAGLQSMLDDVRANGWLPADGD